MASCRFSLLITTSDNYFALRIGLRVFRSLEPHLAQAVLISCGWRLKFQSEPGEMAGAQAVSLATRAFRPAPFVELRQRLPSRVSVISPFVEQLMRFVARFRNRDESERDIETVLREALANAIVHGNLEDSRKCVYVACRCTADGGVSITVEDEGQGFATESVADPITPGNRRGIYLMKTLMDEVRFERHGAVVYLRKASNARPWAEKKKA
jgi:serine/threonine-protein kinase RsbW